MARLNNLARLKYGAPPPAQCWGATATIQEDAPLDEDDTDAPPLALSNEAAQPVRDPQPESSIDAALGNPFTSRGRINDVAPEEASDDAPLNDDVLRGIAASGGARQASYERLVAEFNAVKCEPSEDALSILRRQEVRVKDLCDLSYQDLQATGIDQIDAHKIWSKIEVLRNRKIARRKSRGGC